MDILNVFGAVIFTSAANILRDALIEAVSKGADLRGANLRGADLRDADLRDADLRDADLGGADLRDADLRDADLGGANLGGADLGGADLGGADLGGANLRGADLGGAKNAELTIARLQFIPLEGEFVAWKKTIEGVVKLLIPADAKRSHATERKCRASKAIVLETPNGKEAHSLYFKSFVYRVGETVTPDGFDENRWNVCGPGIHFYITPQEAEAHI